MLGQDADFAYLCSPKSVLADFLATSPDPMGETQFLNLNHNK